MSTIQATKPLSKAAQKREDIKAAILRLRELFPPGSTVYTSLKSVSRSGMYRHIAVFCGKGPGDISNVSGLVSLTLGRKWHDDDSVGAGGCGMDMGFDIVYSLGRSLWHDGFMCSGKGCQSNDHSNGDRDYTPHKHSDAGYSLRHRWI